MDLPDLFPGFTAHTFHSHEARIFARIGGSETAPPLVLLHGYPQTHVMWAPIASDLAKTFRVIVPDLRGYGWSQIVDARPDHAQMSKRALAEDIVALAYYRAAASAPERIAAMCEDYRAGYGIDRALDEADRAGGKMIGCPTLALWGNAGFPADAVDPESTPLAIWRQWATHVEGEPIAAGHFIVEENPADTLAALQRFLSAN